MELSAGTELGKYTVVAQIGQGGMAAVYKVRHNHLGSFLALKVLRNPSPEVARRLEREGRLQARLAHPNVVRVLDTLDIGGYPGLLMEFIEGLSLAQLLDSTSRLDIEEIDALATGILRGVGAAHALGWLHRDLKPGNVMLDTSGHELVPKVTDFGLAKVLDHLDQTRPGSDRTPTGAVLGTWRYMAPEQLRGVPADQRADVFALGSVLYALTSGVPPFAGESIEACVRQITEGRYRDPTELRTDLPERMVATIRAALQLAIEDRPADAGALLELWTDQEAATGRFRRETLARARATVSGEFELPGELGADSTPTRTATAALTPTPEAVQLEASSVELPKPEVARSVGSGASPPDPLPKRGPLVPALGVAGVLAVAAAGGIWLRLGTEEPPVAPAALPMVHLATFTAGGHADGLSDWLGSVLEADVRVEVVPTAAAALDALVRSDPGSHLALLDHQALQDQAARLGGIQGVAEVVRPGWGAHGGAWLLGPEPVRQPSDLRGRTLCFETASVGWVESWLRSGSLTPGADVVLRMSPADTAGCELWAVDHHAGLAAARASHPDLLVSPLADRPSLVLVSSDQDRSRLERLRTTLSGAVVPEALGYDEGAVLQPVRGALSYDPQAAAYLTDRPVRLQLGLAEGRLTQGDEVRRLARQLSLDLEPRVLDDPGASLRAGEVDLVVVEPGATRTLGELLALRDVQALHTDHERAVLASRRLHPGVREHLRRALQAAAPVVAEQPTPAPPRLPSAPTDASLVVNTTGSGAGTCEFRVDTDVWRGVGVRREVSDLPRGAHQVQIRCSPRTELVYDAAVSLEAGRTVICWNIDKDGEC